MLSKIRILLLLCCGLTLGCSFAQPNGSAISPIPTRQSEPDNKSAIAFGKQLYYDTLLSKSFADSCNSCHIVNRGGVDNLTRYMGINNKIGSVNTPTVLNSIFNFRQFWDGRAHTIEDVIEDHLKDKTIYANDWNEVLKRIKASSGYKRILSEKELKNLKQQNVKAALLSYLETLTTPNARFDQYLHGNKTAISPNAIKGYELFRDYGCVTCHQGPNIGGNLYQKLGIYKDYFANRQNIQKADLGLFNVTGKESDKYVFKVPSLRNISLTGPYLHDGSIKTLAEMIQIMAVYQVGQTIPAYDVMMISEYLQSLTGALPDDKQ